MLKKTQDLTVAKYHPAMLCLNMLSLSMTNNLCTVLRQAQDERLLLDSVLNSSATLRRALSTVHGVYRFFRGELDNSVRGELVEP
jgi:hypothetical protein